MRPYAFELSCFLGAEGEKLLQSHQDYIAERESRSMYRYGLVPNLDVDSEGDGDTSCGRQ